MRKSLLWFATVLVVLTWFLSLAETIVYHGGYVGIATTLLLTVAAGILITFTP